MKKTTITGIMALLGMLNGTFSDAQTINKDYVDGRIIFQLKENTLLFRTSDAKGKINLNDMPFLTNLSGKYGIAKATQKHPRCKDASLSKVYEIEFNKKSNADSLVAELNRLPFIRYAEKKALRRVALTPNDPYYSSQWHLAKINAGLAWNISTGSSKIVVADVDNAILVTHPDLASKISPKSYDIADGDNNPSPPAQTAAWDHGTVTSGVIGAATNNTIGISSIGYNVSIMAVKVTRDTAKSGDEVEFGWDGIIYAADSGANVISCAWVGGAASTYEQDVINYAYNAGCIIVAAAGNGTNNNGIGVSTMAYPAACTHVIAVASTGKTDVLSGFSNFGSWITVCAPGDSIISTITNHTGTMSIPYYDQESGTSLSCPMVAGLCGLMLSVNPSLTQAQVLSCLQSSCDNINSANPGNTGNLGAGRINAQAALQCISAISNPVANFTSDSTLINTGNNVNFYDESTNSPTSWTWTFTGGTPSSSVSQNPSGIVYNTPGCYAVTLSVSNSTGSNSVSKTCYIDVIKGSITTACTELVNFTSTDTGTVIPFSHTGGNWGYVSGTSSLGTIAICEYFASPPPAGYNVSAVGIAFAEAYASAPSHTVKFTLWDNVSGQPGNILASSEVSIAGMVPNTYSYKFFDAPVNVTGPYYVGVQFAGGYSLGRLDTLVVITDKNGESNPNTGWFEQFDGTWHSYNSALGLNLSNYIFSYVCKISSTTTAINETKSPMNMELFPNPTSGALTIQLTPGDFNENSFLTVYNVVGAVVARVARADMQNGTIYLNLAGETPGLYFAEIRTETGTVVKKIVLER